MYIWAKPVKLKDFLSKSENCKHYRAKKGKLWKVLEQQQKIKIVLVSEKKKGNCMQLGPK